MKRYLSVLTAGVIMAATYAVVATPPVVHAQPFGPGCASGGMMGPGMMGPGMMPNGMMGPGMMGPGMWSGGPATAVITLDQAMQAVNGCLQSLGNLDLEAEEVMEFQNNFYAIVEEKSTGMGAFELLVN